jgi:hypothetical protein
MQKKRKPRKHINTFWNSAVFFAECFFDFVDVVVGIGEDRDFLAWLR